MLTIFRSTDLGLEQRDEITLGCWVSLIDPTVDEIEQITSLGIPTDFITSPLDIDERARTEREDDGTTLILIRIPYFQGTTVDVPYLTIPLAIIFNEQFIVTVCRRQNEIVQEFSSNKIRNLSTAKRNRFILKLLLATANKYLTFLRQINQRTEALEDQLQLSMQNKEVLELLKYQKSLVYFTTGLKTNEMLMERLQRSQLFRMYPDDEDLLEDVITENQQALEMVNISNNILSSMMDAFASIISNNLNVVMKFLASVTIILNIPTIVFAFWGMNVTPLPFQGSSFAYLIIIGISIGLIAATTFMFVKRKWF
jgi:magnesium transporter